MPDYFTTDELRALPQMATQDATRVTAVAAYVTAVIEREVGTSFIERNQTETHDGGVSSFVISPFARSLTSVTVDGVALTVGDLSLRSGVVRYKNGGTFGGTIDDIVVVYVDGYSTTPPADIKEAALQATRARLLETDSNAIMNDRRSSVAHEAGGTTTFVLPGSTDHPFGYPSVDAVVCGWRNKLKVYGFG